MNRELTFADPASTTSKLVAKGNTGHISAKYRDFVEVFSKGKMKTLLPHHSIDLAIDLEPRYNLPDEYISNGMELRWMELSSVEWPSMPAIAWNMITCSKCLVMDLDFKIRCHMDGSMSVYCLMIDDMTPDG